VPFDLPTVVGPGIALVVVGVLALVLRWAHPGARTRPDFGLLTAISTVDGAAAGREVQDLLARAGIRATLAPDGAGRFRVLVFHADADRARDVVRQL
jgi:hypothetical protein